MKESSDELNPTVDETGRGAPTGGPARTRTDRLALVIATCGVGYLPLAPGTWGSMVGVGLYLLIEYVALGFLFPHAQRYGLDLFLVDTPRIAFLLIVTMVVTLAGIWAGNRAEKLFQRKDPGAVVIDEVAGQLVALLSVPPHIYGWWGIITAFVLFRVFDIWKPFPARRFERLESGLGIMSDDIVAGAYAAVVNSAILGVYFYFRL